MKMNNFTGILVFLAIVNIVAVDTYVYYQMFHAPKGGYGFVPGTTGIGSSDRGAVPVSKLDSAQRRELARIKKMFRSSTDEIYTRLSGLDDEIYELVQQDPVPQDQIDRCLKEMSELRLRRNRIAVNTMIETRSLLTRDQQSELFRAIFPTRRPVTDPQGQTGGRGDPAGGGVRPAPSKK